jgi:hypothetical protein
MIQQPLFEGREVHVTQLKLTGTSGSGRPLAMGEEVVVIARATVTGINHVDSSGQLVRTHSAKVSEAYEVPDDLNPEWLLDQAAKLADADRQTRLRAVEADDA